MTTDGQPCTECGVDFDPDLFDRRSKDGPFRPQCKSCSRPAARVNEQRYAAKKKAELGPNYKALMRKEPSKPPDECKVCQKPFSEKEFKKRSDTGTWRHTCNQCEYAKGYSQKSRSRNKTTKVDV
jgi:hypothetical protein